MISSCAAESWESWEEEAVKYLKEKKTQMEHNDGAAATAIVSTQQPQHGIENIFDMNRGSGGESEDDGSTLDDLNDLTGLQHLFNEFFSSISTVEQYREPNVRDCNFSHRTIRLALLVLPLTPVMMSCRAFKCKL